MHFLASSAEFNRNDAVDQQGDGTGPIESNNGTAVSPAPACELEMELTSSIPDEDDDNMDEDFAPLFEEV